MRRSNLFVKTTRQAPADEAAKNAQLLIRAGYVYKVMAGVYAYTPLGLRVLERIKQIVREEMNAIGGQELIMTGLQKKETWEQTGRWDDKAVDVWFKTKLHNGTELGLAWSHEEIIIEMLKNHISSYKDLPVYVYQFQTKLRNELRAKSGILRGREFVMKDMYSCSLDEEQHERFYQASIDAYMNVYKRVGIGDSTYVTFASGGAFTQFSHEFQTICEAGEDIIYLHRGKNIAVNEEVLDEATLKKLGVAREDLEPVKAAEVGNIFNFGTRQKSEKMDFAFTDEKGKKQFVYLGSYGLGVTRLMGVVVEKFADDKGIIWPESIAPFHVVITRLGDAEAVVVAADELYDALQRAGVETLYDDREARPGEKFADAELMGIPYRVVVSERGLATGTFEVVARKDSEKSVLTRDELFSMLRNR